MIARVSFIGLGSNVGWRATNLSGAIRALEGAGLKASLRSSVYRTDPVEVIDQHEFLNQVVGCESGLTPEDILDICLGVERAMGRIRTMEKGPRVIDLDLLLCRDEVRSGGGLHLPHPRMHLRRFVLVPLAEIAPGAWHPVLQMTAVQLLERCRDASRVQRIVD